LALTTLAARILPTRIVAARILATRILATRILAARILAARILAARTLYRMQALSAIARTAGAGLARTRGVARRLSRLDRRFGSRCCARHVIGHRLGGHRLGGHRLGRCIACGNRRVFALRIHSEGLS